MLVIPKVFAFTPAFNWFVTGLGLIFMARARDLFVTDHEKALSQAKQENGARKNAETDSAQRQKETELKNRQLTMLNQLGQALSKLAPLQEILERIGLSIGQVFDTSNLYIALYDEAERFISFPVYWMEGKRIPNIPGRPLGTGLTELVIRTCAPVHISELAEQPLAASGVIPVGTPCKCYLGVPITLDGRVIGVISLQDYQKTGIFDHTHIEFLSTIASQAAIAIENARMYEKLQLQLLERERAEEALKKSEEEARRSADRSHIVNRIGLKIATDLDFEQLMQTIYEQCEAIARSDSFYIAFYDSATHILDYRFSYSSGKRVYRPASDLTVNAGITGHIVQSRSPLYIPDANVLPEGINPVTISSQPSRTRSYLGLPLVVGERVIGVLSMQSGRPNAYEAGQIQTLELLATQVSIAIKNSQLYERLKTTLKEREALIRELYHRTRNNMNVIIALLNMQAEDFTDERVIAMFAVAENRIRSMAMVHEKLIETGDLSRINLKVYIGDLMIHLMRSYDISPERVSFVSMMEDVEVSLDAALPCGLILNELITNSLKHAFPDGRDGHISIHLRQDGDASITLLVVDDGIGFPRGFNVREHGNLGLKNIFLLGEQQLRAAVRFEAAEGVACELRFRDDYNQTCVQPANIVEA